MERTQDSILGETPGELMAVIHVGVVALGAIVVAIPVLWLQGTQWLVDHKILIPATSEPLVEVQALPVPVWTVPES